MISQKEKNDMAMKFLKINESVSRNVRIKPPTPESIQNSMLQKIINR
jgi:hypothetical protein